MHDREWFYFAPFRSVIFKWTIATHPRDETRFSFREYTLGPRCFHPLFCIESKDSFAFHASTDEDFFFSLSFFFFFVFVPPLSFPVVYIFSALSLSFFLFPFFLFFFLQFCSVNICLEDSARSVLRRVETTVITV